MLAWRVFYNQRRASNATKVVVFLFLLSSFVFCLNSANAQTTSSVSGTVFEDLNLNQTLDYGEKPLSAWQVDLYQNDKLIQTRLTDSGGNYYFADLTAGNYLLKLAVPDSWAPVGGKNVLFNLKADQAFNINFANYQVVQKKQEFGPMLLISNISVKSLSPTAVEVSWFTTHQATSQVVFAEMTKFDSQLGSDINFGYLSSSAIDFKVATYHSVTLIGLKPDATYYYRVSSLANPKQWSGAKRVFSQEFSFKTGPAASLKTNEEIKVEETKKPTGKVMGIEKKGNIATPLPEEITPEVQPQVSATATLPELESQPPKEKPATDNCSLSIWVLLFLNLILILLIRAKAKRTKNSFVQRLWWLIAIFVLVPLIFGYPQCWLTIWLLITLFIALTLLSGFRKKPPLPPAAKESSFADDKTNSWPAIDF